MAPSAIKVQPITELPTPSVKKLLSDNKLSTSEHKTVFGDFRDDLIRDGYAVIKGAVPKDRADSYGSAFYDFLESL